MDKVLPSNPFESLSRLLSNNLGELSLPFLYASLCLSISIFKLSPALSLCLVGATFGLWRLSRGTPATLAGNRIPARFGGKRFEFHAMPVNHFGEKARWILDLLQVKYDEVNHGGLLSMFIEGRTVPYLIDRKSCSTIGNSDEIIQFLQAVSAKDLTPLQQQLLSHDSKTEPWIAVLNEYGHSIQGYCYFYLLGPSSSTTATKLAWGVYEVSTVPLLDRLLLRLFYPALKAAMRQAFDLSRTAPRQERLASIRRCLAMAEQALKQGGPFLTGQHLSWVDVTFCSLTAPLLFSTLLFTKGGPSPYANGRFKSFGLSDVEWNNLVKETPKELKELELEIMKSEVGRYVERTYTKFRGVGLK